MIAKLDPKFMPMAKVMQAYKEAVSAAESQTLCICVERNGGLTAVYRLDIYKENKQ